jgi:hypothetical protein
MAHTRNDTQWHTHNDTNNNTHTHTHQCIRIPTCTYTVTHIHAFQPKTHLQTLEKHTPKRRIFGVSKNTETVLKSLFPTCEERKYMMFLVTASMHAHTHTRTSQNLDIHFILNNNVHREKETTTCAQTVARCHIHAVH